MLRRLSAAMTAGRSAAAQIGQPRDGGNGSLGPLQASWALIHFGDPGPITARLADHLAGCRARGLQCLLVSDEIPQVCVGTRDIVFEFLPWPATTALSVPGGFAAASEHSHRRLSLILTFWQVVGCDCEGAQAMSLLAEAPDWSHPLVRARSDMKRAASQNRERMLP